MHSFDLVAVNEHVTACDMTNVPLEKETVDVVIFSLSLMGTNYEGMNDLLLTPLTTCACNIVFPLFCLDFIREASRVLKKGGEIKIAEAPACTLTSSYPANPESNLNLITNPCRL